MNIKKFKETFIFVRNRFVKLSVWVFWEFRHVFANVFSNSKKYRRLTYGLGFLIIANQFKVESDRYKFMAKVRIRDEQLKIQNEGLISEIEGLEEINLVDHFKKEKINIEGKYSIIFHGGLKSFFEFRREFLKIRNEEKDLVQLYYMIKDRKEVEIIDKLIKIDLKDCQFVNFKEENDTNIEIFTGMAILFNPEGKPVISQETNEKIPAIKFSIAISKDKESKYLKKMDFTL